MSAHISTGLGGKKYNRPLEILGCTPATGRYPLRDTLEPLGVGKQGLIHIGGDVPGGDTVDGDTAVGPLVGKCLGYLGNATFTGGVGGDGDATLEGQEGAEVNDAPLSARGAVFGQLEHMGGDIAAQGKRGVEVDLDHLVEVTIGELLARVTALDARAVDQDADLVALAQDTRDQAGDVGRGGEVGGEDVSFAAEGLDGL